jgi:hypothetical protein
MDMKEKVKQRWQSMTGPGIRITVALQGIRIKLTQGRIEDAIEELSRLEDKVETILKEV